ncbi:hypothetical protein ABBQ32_004034 [Trebouxia sp. C0010 RCD-2024]
MQLPNCMCRHVSKLYSLSVMSCAGLAWAASFASLHCALCSCRAVFGPYGVRVFLCFWHVKRSWLKNLHRKCPRSVQYQMFLTMEKIMLMLPATGQSREGFAQQVHASVESFTLQYAEQADFVSYFQKQWGKKTGDRRWPGELSLPQYHSPVCEAEEPFTDFKMIAPTLGMRVGMKTHTDSMLMSDQPSRTSVMQCGIVTAATSFLILCLADAKAPVKYFVRSTLAAAMNIPHQCIITNVQRSTS